MQILFNDDPVMADAHRQYKEFTADDELRELYLAREKQMRDEASRLYSAEHRGREKERLSMAKALKEQGVSIEIIMNTTHFDREFIENL